MILLIAETITIRYIKIVYYTKSGQMIRFIIDNIQMTR